MSARPEMVSAYFAPPRWPEGLEFVDESKPKPQAQSDFEGGALGRLGVAIAPTPVHSARAR